MAQPTNAGGPPWLTPKIQQRVTARDGDIWISAAPKSGTNWMMNIVHQLLTGGDGAFDSIYSVVAWPELIERPGQPPQEILTRIEAMPTDRRRPFKSHSAPPELPFITAGAEKDVKYVVVCRNPEEALVSFKVFLEQHTNAFYALWQVPKAAMTRPDFTTFYREVAGPNGMHGIQFRFLASWWPLRREPNVLLLHFADLKRDLSGVTRKVARFLGIALGAVEWAKIDEYVSFDWMKKNEVKFETHTKTPVPVMEAGSMIRKGKTGAAHEDGMTEEISEQLRELGATILTDPAALQWLYEGGSVV